jgi:phospholipid/cholesterol/gamma-HCH transport system substrate-binding protein
VQPHIILTRRPRLTGLVLIAVAVAATLLLFQKSAIVSALRPGETLTVQLARDYKLDPYAAAVKIAGTKVGVVQSVETAPEQSAAAPVQMRLKLYSGTRALLGTAPSAVIRPTTVLGGTYYVQLYPGGEKGTASSDIIPVQRTKLPVELDQLLSAIPSDAQHGLQGMTERLDTAFKTGAGNDLNRLLTDTPDTLRPTGVVADALRGVNKDTDLATLVTNLNRTAKILSDKPGQLRAVVDSLATASRVLGDNAEPIDQTIATLPATLQTVHTGADDLSITLDKVAATADDARPSVKALDPLLRRLDPTLADLRPVVADLYPLLEDAKPLVNELSPTVDKTTDVLDDLRGPVLDRVNGPILGELNSEWHGLAPKYPQGGGDGAKFYQELAYLVSNAGNSAKFQNATTHTLAFHLGVGSTSLSGTGVTGQQLEDYLAEMYGPPHHTPLTPLAPGAAGGIPLPDPGLPYPTVGVPDLSKGLHR